MNSRIINAFTPLHQRPIPQMLFDHALLKGNMEGIDFTVGNLMALSAPGKGMKKNTTTNAKTLSKNVNENGGKLTEEFIKIVKEILGYEGTENLNEDIKNIQNSWDVPDDFKDKLKAALKEKKYENDGNSQSLMDRIELEIGLPQGMDKQQMIRAIEVEIDNSKKYYALQSLGSNKIWDAQNLGGFKLPEKSLYQNIQGEKMGENNIIDSPTVELLVESAVPNNGILFLCESALIFGYDGKSDKGKMLDGTEINHVLVHKDKKYEKVYSAIWMRNDIAVKEVLNIDISTGDNPKIDITKEDYCVFSVIKSENEVAKVVVVHTNNAVAKNGKEDTWNSFLQKCKGMGGNIYVVGDTNVTNSKTSKQTNNYKPFEANGEFVEKSIVTEFKIKKRRVPGNIWKNNQIYKFQPSNEPDGMVILKLKPSSSVEATVAPTKIVPATADTTGASAVDTTGADAATAAAPAAAADTAAAADREYQPRGTAKVVAEEVGKIRQGWRDLFKRKKGGKRKKRTKRKRKNRKKNSKKRTKRKK